MEVLDAPTETTWVAPDLVQRHEWDVAVEGGVLHPFGHHRPGHLLETEHELRLQLPADSQQEEVEEKGTQVGVKVRSTLLSRRDRAFNDGAVEIADGVARPDVRAVDGKPGDDRDEKVVQFLAGVI